MMPFPAAPLAQPIPLASSLSPLLLLAAMVIGFVLLVQRPMRRQQDAQRKLQDGLAEGSRVMLTSGIFGTVTHVGEKQAIVELAPGLEVTVVRQAISKVVTPDEEEFEFDDAAPASDGAEAVGGATAVAPADAVATDAATTDTAHDWDADPTHDRVTGESGHLADPVAGTTTAATTDATSAAPGARTHDVTGDLTSDSQTLDERR